MIIVYYNTLFKKRLNNSDKFDKKRLKNDEIDDVKQNMFRHLKVYLPIINLVRDNMHVVEKGQLNENEVLELFEVGISFLIGFVKNNPINQELISNYLKIFMYNISLGFGQIELICEIFRDNLILCTTKHNEVIKNIVKLINTKGRNTEYLDFFYIIQQVKNELIYMNQKLILDTFLDPNNKIILMYMKDSEIFE